MSLTKIFVTKNRGYLSGIAKLAYPRLSLKSGYTHLPISQKHIDTASLRADMQAIGQDLYAVLDGKEEKVSPK